MQYAYLTGTLMAPAIALHFQWGAVHPANRLQLTDWVKKAPGRRWDPSSKRWLVTGFGPGKNIDALLAHAGFHFDATAPDPSGGRDSSLDGVWDIQELASPIVTATDLSPKRVWVYPRFLGYEATTAMIGENAAWDKKEGRFTVPLTDLMRRGNAIEGLHLTKEMLEAGRDALQEANRPRVTSHLYDERTIAADTALAASSSGVGDGHDYAAISRLTQVVGDFPEWFGMTPRPYQRLGALAMLAGHSTMADPTGLGKTVQILGALAINDAKRAVILVPPVVVSHWGKEIERCHVAKTPPKPPRKSKRKTKEATSRAGEAASLSTNSGAVTASPVAPPTMDNPDGEILPDGAGSTASPEDADGRVVPPKRDLAMFIATRKAPEFPESGVVVVPDSLITSRPALLKQIVDWSPDFVAYDEAHRIRDASTARSQAAIALAESLDPEAVRIVSTATPIFSSPGDLVPLLAFTGHLDSVFGGQERFMERYTKKNFFNKVIPRKENLNELHEILNKHVWVRRKKEEVLKDLPPKQRDGITYTVDLKGFRAAHNEVIDKITVWLDEFHAGNNRLPNEDEAKAWSSQQIGLMSPLRKAAGMAKVPVATELISSWIDETVTFGPDGEVKCDRPLVIWVHHHEVLAALREQAQSKVKGGRVEVIDGATSIPETGKIVDDFQDGKIPVLICSIRAASVGITLTKSSDLLFVECDFSVPIMSQAEDRVHRIGQENHVHVRTMVAEGTFDPHIHSILEEKARVIEAITGDNTDVHVDLDDGSEAPSQIINRMVVEAIIKWVPPSARAA